MSDQLKAILDATPTSDRVRAAAWDLFYQTQSADELQSALSGVPSLPSEARARVLQLKAGDQPSATGRFLSGAWEVLNPVEMAKGAYNAVRHPIDTASNILSMHGEQASKAGDAIREGRYPEAFGHSLATVAPLVGPIAAGAGERIGEGDIAGGLGVATGLLAPAGAATAVRSGAKAMRAVPSGARAAAADALEAGAAERVADVMSPKVGPNKVRIGNQADSVAPQVAKDMAQNGAPWTREGLHAQVSERLVSAEQALDAANDARLGARTFDTQPVIDALRKKRQELTSEAVEGSAFPHRPKSPASRGTAADNSPAPIGEDVVPGPNAARVAQIDQAIDELSRLGPVARYDALRRIRQAYDAPAKAIYAPSVTADYLKAQGGKLGAADVTGVLREHLARLDPETAAANSTYHIYRTANDALDAVREIERTRPRVGRAIMARLSGVLLGGEAGGTAGAVAGYAGGPLIDQLLSSGATTKLQTANIMSKLAAAIRRGDVQNVDGLTTQLQRLRRGTSVQRANERATNPSESQTGLVPEM